MSLGTILLLIILLLALLVVLPIWPRRAWGYLPRIVAGLVVIILGILLLMGRL
ncbi:MAG: DUF3309 family protein [Thermodesulfobacteriota bacterium]|nr:DUF3309 family protein [Thermodesulfobacteriota bacterium]